MSLIDDLKKIAAKKNSSPEMRGLLENIQFMQGPKGETGPAPVKGKDYFTKKEIDEIIKYVQENVRPGPQGMMGPRGIGIPGIPGATPVLGQDYFTRSDQDKMLADVLSRIPKPKDNAVPKMEDIVNQAVDELKKKPIEFKDIKGTDRLIEFLKVGGFRGGGDTVVAGNNVTITVNQNGQKVIASTGSSVTGYIVVNSSSAVIVATATSGEVFYNLDTTPNNIALTLPTAVGNNAKFVIKKKDSSTNHITVSSVDLIDGGASFLIDAANYANTFYSDNFNWYVV